MYFLLYQNIDGFILIFRYIQAAIMQTITTPHTTTIAVFIAISLPDIPPPLMDDILAFSLVISLFIKFANN